MNCEIVFANTWTKTALAADCQLLSPQKSFPQTFPAFVFFLCPLHIQTFDHQTEHFAGSLQLWSAGMLCSGSITQKFAEACRLWLQAVWGHLINTYFWIHTNLVTQMLSRLPAEVSAVSVLRLSTPAFSSGEAVAWGAISNNRSFVQIHVISLRVCVGATAQRHFSTFFLCSVVSQGQINRMALSKAHTSAKASNSYTKLKGCPGVTTKLGLCLTLT